MLGLNCIISEIFKLSGMPKAFPVQVSEKCYQVSFHLGDLIFTLLNAVETCLLPGNISWIRGVIFI